MDNILQIIDTLVMASIGIFLGVTFNKNFTTSRVKRTYYIDEVKDLQSEYSLFFKDLYKGKFKPKNIVIWNKIMSERINIIENGLKKTYKIDNSLSDSHFKFFTFLSGHEEFNNSWMDYLKPSDNLKNDLLSKYSVIRNTLHQMILEINECKTIK